MNPIEGLLYGLSVALTPEHLLAAFIGVLAGTVVGLLPGLGPVPGAAILLPLTLTMSPTAGVIMIAGVYYGALFGGSTTAVLLNIPGDVTSVVQAIDGYAMTKQGRAGPALGVAILGSLVAGIVSVILLTLFTPYLARVALAFGPAEFFALTLGGVLVLSQVFAPGVVSGLLPTLLGFALGTIGLEGGTGVRRFTFGSLEMGEGVSLVALAVGMFGLTELMKLAERPQERIWHGKISMRQLMPTKTDIRRSGAPILRGSVLGFILGLLPGPSAAMATFDSYRLEKSVCRHRKEMGKGAVEGVAGPEAANNAAATSSIIPLIALGVPFSATLAFILAALIAHGVTPGPLISVQYPEIFWGVIGSLYIGTMMLVILNVPLIGVWVRAVSVKNEYLIPAIAVLGLAGVLAARNLEIDLFWVVIVTALGYVLRLLNIQLAPLLLGLVLSPLVEKHFREGLVLSGGDIGYLFTNSPIVVIIWCFVLVSILGRPFGRMVGARRQNASQELQ